MALLSVWGLGAGCRTRLGIGGAGAKHAQGDTEGHQGGQARGAGARRARVHGAGPGAQWGWEQCQGLN